MQEIDSQNSQYEQSKNEIPTLNVEVFKETSKLLYKFELTTILERASRDWTNISQRITDPRLEPLTIGRLATLANLSWPSTRYSEPVSKYIGASSPIAICERRGMGKNKAKTVIVIILSLDSAISPKSWRNPISTESDSPVPQDPVDWVAAFWSRIETSVSQSELANVRISDLALRWGFPWPTRARVHHTLLDVVSARSLQDFVSSASGIGRKKIASLAAIVLRAWRESEPDGPAGPADTPADIAKEIYRKCINEKNASAAINEALRIANVKNRERSILLRRYGIGNSAAMTLEEIGQQDQVTRERIRQIQEKAEAKVRIHQVCHELLNLCLENELPTLLKQLEARFGTALLTQGHDLHRWLAPAHSFLVGILYDGVHNLLDTLAEEGRIQKTSAGWWLGPTLPPQARLVADQVRTKIENEGRPLPLRILRDVTKLDTDPLKSVLVSEGFYVEMGYVFPKRLSAGQRRCLFSIKIAIRAQRWLWSELDFYKAGITTDPEKASSQRLLLRDTECIPGVGIDLPGPFVVVNPHAGRNAELGTAGALVPDTSFADEDGDLCEDPASEREESSCWDKVRDETLAGRVQALLEENRILKFDALEEKFCEAGLGAPTSLGPTLLSRPQFVRYAPGYWGIAGLELEEPDVEQLCTEANLRLYVRSKAQGGLSELFPFWNPKMEYRWCRWAEGYASNELFQSLLAVCEPSTWKASDAIQTQWESKKERLGLYRMPAVHPSLETAFIGFKPIYGLVHLVHQKGGLGPMAISHFYGLRPTDGKSYGTMALLAALDILRAREDAESACLKGDRLEEWLDFMSELHFLDPRNAPSRWRKILRSSIDKLDPARNFGWCSGREIQENFARWTANREDLD